MAKNRCFIPPPPVLNRFIGLLDEKECWNFAVLRLNIGIVLGTVINIKWKVYPAKPFSHRKDVKGFIHWLSILPLLLVEKG